MQKKFNTWIRFNSLIKLIPSSQIITQSTSIWESNVAQFSYTLENHNIYLQHYTYTNKRKPSATYIDYPIHYHFKRYDGDLLFAYIDDEFYNTLYSNLGITPPSIPLKPPTITYTNGDIPKYLDINPLTNISYKFGDFLQPVFEYIFGLYFTDNNGKHTLIL